MGRIIYDIHAHVVPGIDDGAVDFDMAIEMLRKAYGQGTRGIVCTSHSDGFMRRYDDNLNTLKHRLKREGIDITLYSGCEIYCNQYSMSDVIYKLDKNIIPKINNTSYILAEFDPKSSETEILTCIDVLRKYHYNVILAHTERYLKLFESVSVIAFLEDMGCLFQINAYSLQDETNVNIKANARWLLKNKLVSFIGSDAHGISHRPYMIKNGIDYIYDNCDEKYAVDICYQNALKLLNT